YIYQLMSLSYYKRIYYLKYNATYNTYYKTSDYDVVWIFDYMPVTCYARNTLAQRVGHYSDNTAAHILVRYLGGSTALNAFARSMGAVQSKFWVPNTTTTGDLARLWWYEAVGAAGGQGGPGWAHPLITETI